jgi:hypothetical protein
MTSHELRAKSYRHGKAPSGNTALSPDADSQLEAAAGRIIRMLLA